MDKETRNTIERATQQARKLLDEDFSSQLEGTFDVLRSGVVALEGGSHLSPVQHFQRDKIVAAIEHKHAAGMTKMEAVSDYVRDAAFTTLNRFVALKMLASRWIELPVSVSLAVMGTILAVCAAVSVRAGGKGQGSGVRGR